MSPQIRNVQDQERLEARPKNIRRGRPEPDPVERPADKKAPAEDATHDLPENDPIAIEEAQDEIGPQVADPMSAEDGIAAEDTSFL